MSFLLHRVVGSADPADPRLFAGNSRRPPQRRPPIERPRFRRAANGRQYVAAGRREGPAARFAMHCMMRPPPGATPAHSVRMSPPHAERMTNSFLARPASAAGTITVGAAGAAAALGSRPSRPERRLAVGRRRPPPPCRGDPPCRSRPESLCFRRLLGGRWSLRQPWEPPVFGRWPAWPFAAARRGFPFWPAQTLAWRRQAGAASVLGRSRGFDRAHRAFGIPPTGSTCFFARHCSAASAARLDAGAIAPYSPSGIRI